MLSMNEKIEFLIEMKIPYSYNWLKSNPKKMNHIYKREKKKFNIRQTTMARLKIKEKARLNLIKKDNNENINKEYNDYPF